MRYLASPGQLRASFWRWALVTVPVVVLLGFLSGKLANSGPDANPWFRTLETPAIYPPPATFGIVWTALYILMGFSLAMVLAAPGARQRRAALAAFAVQFVLNLAWTPLFFAAQQITAAFWLLLALIVAVIATIALFARVRPVAAWLLAPYLAWIAFAAVLNWEFDRLNPGAEEREVSGAAVRIEL